MGVAVGGWNGGGHPNTEEVTHDCWERGNKEVVGVCVWLYRPNRGQWFSCKEIVFTDCIFFKVNYI